MRSWSVFCKTDRTSMRRWRKGNVSMWIRLRTPIPAPWAESDSCSTRIGLPDLLHELDFSKRDIKIACARIIGRALHPGSERHTLDWMGNESSILELLHLDQTLHRYAVKLCTHQSWTAFMGRPKRGWILIPRWFFMM